MHLAKNTDLSQFIKEGTFHNFFNGFIRHCFQQAFEAMHDAFMISQAGHVEVKKLNEKLLQAYLK